MKKLLPILTLSCVIAIAPAHADEAEAAAEAPAVEETAVEEEDPMQRIRCRNVAITGTRARRLRTCMTIAQWTVMAREGNRDARRVMDNIAANNEGAN